MKNFSLHGFENPLWLLLGACFIGVLLFIFLSRKQKQNFLHEDIVRQVYHHHSIWYRIYVGCIFVITSLFFIILAGPYTNQHRELIERNGIDIEIVFDLSYSMIAEDIKPSRIEVAKNVFGDFLKKLENDRVGIVLFSGKVFRGVPLSYDYDFLESFIQDLDIETIDQNNLRLQGTAIGDALVLASDVLKSQEQQREKVIILITDGEANRGVDPATALKVLKQEAIKTYTIGVGKDEDTTIKMLVGPGIIQELQVGGIDEEILKKIADETGGEYFRADSKDSLENILATISRLEKTPLQTETIKFHHSIVDEFLYLLLLCFGVLGYIVFCKRISI